MILFGGFWNESEIIQLPFGFFIDIFHQYFDMEKDISEKVEIVNLKKNDINFELVCFMYV